MPPLEAIPNDARHAQRSANPVALVLLMLVSYAAVVFGSGTMQHSDNQTIAEAGEAIQDVTLIEPVIQWTFSHGLAPVADLLRHLADGIDPHTILTLLSYL